MEKNENIELGKNNVTQRYGNKCIINLYNYNRLMEAIDQLKVAEETNVNQL